MKMPALMAAPVSTIGEFRLAVHMTVFVEFAIAEQDGAHSHVPTPNLNGVDRSLREIGPAQKAFRSVSQDPIWRGFFPNWIDGPTKNVVLRLLGGDPLSSEEHTSG